MDELHILRPQGFINADTGADLRDRIHSLTVGDPRSVLIDCSAITFMDSSGFSCLITALKKLRRQGRELFLCSLNSQLRVILETTGTIQVFRIFPTSAECLLHVEQAGLLEDGERSLPAG
ncbi:STAS domain-containing protein [Synechococcus sp. CS-1328]|uniref:STAS domain-containing protein n=1 Tax=Synechococcus sp. CS-1328 TaxID=2847976 RepID=UPI00223AFB5B|nr:STAS domain-containing protein [Synechococcus sp. CS-1328]MCT0225555.1 STAS domain-containing protein [Synechococcus sp. CS-1328]